MARPKGIKYSTPVNFKWEQKFKERAQEIADSKQQSLAGWVRMLVQREIDKDDAIKNKSKK